MRDRRDELISHADAWYHLASYAQRQLFSVMAELDALETEDQEDWESDGARDGAYWLWMRYGVSSWKAYRWMEAAHALDTLPLISEAFSRGELSIDKVVELTRFATPQTEERLIPWAQRVSCGAIRIKG